MSLIINIDTAVEKASVCIAHERNIIGIKSNFSQKDHAAWIHVAIQEICKEQNLTLNKVAAIAVSAGPGSYTGLRVGMATAKGLCYALNIPFIAVGTLKMMAFAATQSSEIREPQNLNTQLTYQPISLSNLLLCPMIDARRKEVFTAVYNTELTELLPPQNLILGPETFHHFLKDHSLFFFGNGSIKFRNLINHENAHFLVMEADARHLANLSYDYWLQGKFSDTAYSEPFYGKDFYFPPSKPPE
ncbi:MAG: tRNA (adenosine(37)-N6)-threonylcarbamoyltransferase complex dimerization subunit type 1 TsaB [Chitinophagaceae bacterium]